MKKISRRRYKEKHLIDELKERYIYLENFLVKNRGYIIIIKKMKTKGGEPINIDILDLKNEVDFEIRKIIRKIDHKLDLYEVPDGIKK